jgi:predicted RNA binding protein YcfA (HicA-like mRNA interferase family)
MGEERGIVVRLHALERDLAAQGWHLHHQRGSHRIYRRDGCGGHITVSLHGGEHTSVCWRKVEQVRRDVERLERQAS